MFVCRSQMLCVCLEVLIYTVSFQCIILSVWVGPNLVSEFTNVLLLFEGAQPCFFVLTNAPFLLCLLEGSSCVCSLMPHVSVWIGPISSACAHQCITSVCVCLEGPIWYVLTNAPLLFGGARFCSPVLNSAPCL